VKLKGTTDEAVTIQSARVVTFLADPGAKLTRSAGGAIVTVRDDGTSLAIYDLAISDAPNSASGFGLVIPTASGTPAVSLNRVTLSNNPGGGISASGGTLTMSRSTVSGIGNGAFAIVGNVFFNNGTQTGSVGGLSITASQSASNRLELNSFNKNQVQVGLGSAIQCIAGTFTARSNIMSENGTLANMEQFGGTCTHAYSIVRPGTLPPGTGNSAADPMFINATTGDLHLQAGSPARQAADPAADLSGIAARDIDGDIRMAPADIGADEAAP
jgi:hypothetical protein